MNYQEIHDTSRLLGMNPFEAIGAVEGDKFICDDEDHEWYGKLITFTRPMQPSLGIFTYYPESTVVQAFFLHNLKPYEPEGE